MTKQELETAREAVDKLFNNAKELNLAEDKKPIDENNTTDNTTDDVVEEDTVIVADTKVDEINLAEEKKTTDDIIESLRVLLTKSVSGTDDADYSFYLNVYNGNYSWSTSENESIRMSKQEAQAEKDAEKDAEIVKLKADIADRDEKIKKQDDSIEELSKVNLNKEFVDAPDSTSVIDANGKCDVDYIKSKLNR